MPIPLLIGGGLLLTSGAFYTGAEAAEKTTRLLQWATVAGSIYLFAKYKKVI